MPPSHFPDSPKTDIPHSCPLLSAPQCYAKTRKDNTHPEDLTAGASVEEHLRVTCLVFRELKKRWVGHVRERFFFPEGEWLSAFHDIGKMSPSFQQKIYEALHQDVPWQGIVPESTGGHARNSAIVLEDYGKRISEAFAEKIAILAGSHHGIPLSLSTGDTLQKDELGGEDWQKQRLEILEKLRTELHLSEDFTDETLKEADILVLGATILADWISSSIELPPGKAPSSSSIHNAVQNTGFIPHPIQEDMSFHTLFGFDYNPLQQNMIENVVPGGIYVVESGMGSGKTEAALALAYSLLEKKQADGIYFALPTRLTSEKIYDRLNQFLQKISPEKSDLSNAILIHGDSWLQWNLPSPDENGTLSRHRDSWFQSKKRALLAPFGAGTVDQALLSIIRAKHNALRAFALVGKVVILDEIHSYDAYTANLLRILIGKLREWGCTVIILSATLTRKACCEFAHIAEHALTDDSYPRILINDQNHVKIISMEAESPSHVQVSMETEEEKALGEAFDRANHGEQVLWIENTVNDVQRVYRRFAEVASGIELGIIHSRYSSDERATREGYWTQILGKHGQTERSQKGRILIASQVLEQSVDVDADFLVTRIAPADFLFQRIGRLWRHPRNRPAGAVRKAVFLVDPILFDPDQLLANSKKLLPYDPYCLYRSVEALQERSELVIPSDIRPILEAVYQERPEVGALAELKKQADSKREKLEGLSRRATAKIGETLRDDDPLGTRYVEDDNTVQVLLLKNGNSGDKLNSVLHPIDGDPIPLSYSSPQGRLAITRKLLGKIIKVRECYAPSSTAFPTSFLSDFLWTGNSDYSPVRIAYVDDATGKLLDHSCNPLVNSKGLLYYTRILGYELR